MYIISFMLLLIVSIKLITFGWKLNLVYNSTLLWTENKLPELLTIDASHQISNLSALFQPHSVESGIIGLSSIALRQIMAWKCVIMMWCLAAFLVRGNSSGLIPFWNSVTRALYVVECNLQMKCSHSLTVASVRGSLPSCERSSVFSRKIGNAFRFVWPAKYEVVSDPVSAWKGINASAGSGLNSQDVMSSFTRMYFGFLLVPAFILHMCTMKHTAGIGLFMSTSNTKHI